jgi:hypothetical protein
VRNYVGFSHKRHDHICSGDIYTPKWLSTLDPIGYRLRFYSNSRSEHIHPSIPLHMIVDTFYPFHDTIDIHFVHNDKQTHA